MSHVDVERADVGAADVAVGAASFVTGVLVVAAVVDNEDVKNNNFNRTII